MLVHQHFYQLNSGRKYPLEDTASGDSDEGQTLPSDLLVDASLQFPNTLGHTPFLSSVTVTDRLVAITFQAEGAASLFQPLAVLTLQQPVVPGRVYPLLPQASGVGGYVAFGSGVRTRRLSLRFSSADQTRLTPAVYRAYEPLAVQSVGKQHNASGLQGVVRLTAREPLEFDLQELEIDGEVRQAIVLQIKASPDQAEVLTRFAGPCGRRPESYTCGDVEPVERVAAVSPDCNGELVLEFEGCADLVPIAGGHGVVIACDVGLGDVCVDPLPDALGTFAAVQSDCVYDWFPGESDSDGGESDSESDQEGSDSDSEPSPAILPYLECFSSGTAPGFTVPSGEFSLVEDDSPEEPCGGSNYSYATEGEASAGSRNISVLAQPIDSTIGKTFTTELKLTEGPHAHNAGLLVNYQPHPTLAGRFTWFVAEIDYDELEFRIRRFNGSVLTTLISTSVPALQLDEWYRITVNVASHLSADASITATLEGVDSPGVTASIGPLLTNNYFPADGFAGFHANRSLARFSYLSIEETP